MNKLVPISETRLKELESLSGWRFGTPEKRELLTEIYRLRNELKAAPSVQGFDDNDLQWLRGLVFGEHQDNLLSHGRAARFLAAYEAHQPQNRVPAEPMDIQLGDGSTLVSDIKHPDGWSGIAFSPNGPGEVGRGVSHSDGVTDNDLKAFCRIRTSNPDSLRIVIAACNRALQTLEPNRTPAELSSLPDKWREDKREGRFDYYEGACDAKHKCANELEAALASMGDGWLPISDAPKDGPILHLSDGVNLTDAVWRGQEDFTRLIGFFGLDRWGPVTHYRHRPKPPEPRHER